MNFFKKTVVELKHWLLDEKFTGETAQLVY